MFAKYKKRFKRCLISLLAVLTTFVILISSSFTVSAFSDVTQLTNSWDYQFQKFWVGSGANVTYKTALLTDGDPFASSSYVGDFACYYPEPVYNSFHFGFNFPTTFSSGQIITVSGAFMVQSTVTSLTLNWGGFSGTQLFNKNHKVYNNVDSSVFYYYLPFSVTFNVNSFNLPYLDEIFFTITGSNIRFIGVQNIKIQINTDTAGIVGDAADDIINNQNSNTDKVLNGGHDSPSYDDYSSNGAISDAEDFESHYNDKGQDALDEYNQLGTAINNLFGNPNNPVYNGVSAMSYVVARVTGESWVYNLLIIALYFGLFGYIVNALSTIIRPRDNGNSSHKNKNP